jgi:hypothetical protein
VLATVAAAGLRLHGFGLKTQALQTCAEYLVSADSLAWSRDAYEKRNHSGRHVCVTRSGGSIHDLRG